MTYREKFGFIMNPNAKRTKQICFIVIDALQQFRKEDIVVAVGILWLMLCDRFNLKPCDVLNTSEAIIRDSFSGEDQDQLTALKEYMKNELK